jgi:hypothetical protein
VASAPANYCRGSIVVSPFVRPGDAVWYFSGERKISLASGAAAVRIAFDRLFQLHGLAVRGVLVGVSPRLFPGRECLVGCETAPRHKTLESCEPVFVVPRSVIRLTARRRSLQFGRVRCCPL